MARKRMIDPEFFLDERLTEVSAFARLLFIGLWQICDDNRATLPNRSKWIKAQVFPYDAVNIDKLLSELETAEVIVKFINDGQEYWYIKNFFKYQRVDRPSKAKYPQYDKSTHTTLVEGSSRARTEVKLSKDKLSKDKLSKDKLSKDNTNVLQKVEYGSPEINEAVSYMKEKLGLPILDESVQVNRNYTNLLLKKFGGIEKLKLLIDATAAHDFWATRVTSMKTLYYKGVNIISSNRDIKNSVTKL